MSEDAVDVPMSEDEYVERVFGGWLSFDYWTLEQAVDFLCGTARGPAAPEPAEPERERVGQQLLAAGKSEVLRMTTQPDDYGHGIMIHGFRPNEVVPWAIDKGMPMLPQFREAYEGLPYPGAPVGGPSAKPFLRSRRSGPSLEHVDRAMDPDGEHASADLIAAIEAWIAVFVTGYGPRSTSPKAKLRKWLDENRGSLSDAARNRAAMIANPSKSGGVPKSD